MYFVSSEVIDADSGLVSYGITDTADGVEEFYNLDEITALAKKVEIHGVGFSQSNTISVGLFDLKNFVLRLKLSGLVPDGMEITVEENNIVLEEYTNKENTGIVEVPNYISVIGECCFSKSDISGVVLPDGLSYIDSRAFYRCFNLKSIYIPDSVVEIGHSAFEYCTNLRDIKLPNRLKVIQENCFNCCRDLESIEISTEVEVIKRNAFSDTSLTHITLPSTLKELEPYCFYFCGMLETINVLTNSLTIGYGCFMNCESLRRIECYHMNVVKTFQSPNVGHISHADIILYY